VLDGMATPPSPKIVVDVLATRMPAASVAGQTLPHAGGLRHSVCPVDAPKELEELVRVPARASKFVDNRVTSGSEFLPQRQVNLNQVVVDVPAVKR
jgi:hypothetical protein